MFYIHQSNALEVLKTWMIDIIEKNPLENPLENEQILVQNPGMAQWLQQQIAASSGVAAAIQFPLPASFIWRLFQTLLDGVPEQSAFAKESMTWKLTRILPEKIDDPAYHSLRHYLLPETEKNNRETLETEQIRLYQLSAKIADTFDQYLVYRPDWIKAWEQGKTLPAITGEHPWQPLLWKALTEYTADMEQPHWHRGNLLEALQKSLHTLSPEKKGSFPKRLFVFGLSTLPPAYLALLKSVSSHTDVHLMVHNPCQMYWGEAENPRQRQKEADQQRGLHFSDTFNIAEGNTLLGSMGKQGRDYHLMLSEMEAIGEERFYDPLDRFHKYNECLPTLLSYIQSQVLNFEEPEDKITIDSDDNSLIINSCHSVLREAEVLHDYLLDLFEKDDTLTPRDIIIMAPDVERYSPAIQAVFSSAPEERFIPFSISDINARRENPLFEALLKILTCHRERCTITDILSILEVPSVMRRFGITPDQLDTLQRWIKGAGIRWGLDANGQKQQGLPANYQNTWQFGIDRLLLGYAIESEDALYRGTLPAQDIEGLEASLCGLFIDFIEALKSISHELPHARTASKWTVIIYNALDTFFQPDPDEALALQMVRELFTDLCEQTMDPADELIISHEVIYEWLTEHLEQHKSSRHFLNGRVNVCTLMPMRSIPFKVICLLGMNDGAYPRSIPPGSFDLAARFPRTGDRSRRDDDRYLFLEALLAARDHFYISYNGRCVTDNSVRVPSVLVAELKDYCSRHFIISDGHEWVTEHPLQPYSPEYFTAHSHLFSYAKEWINSGSNMEQKTSPVFINGTLREKEKPGDISLDELQRFYRHPCKYFFQRRLGVSFNTPEKNPFEDEPFSVSGLDLYNIRLTLLDSLLENESLSGTTDLVKATGLLPLGHFGTIAMEEITNRITGFAKEIKPWITSPSQRHEISFNLNTCRLGGWIRGVHQNRIIRYQPGKRGNNLLVSSMIEHILWCAHNPSAEDTHIFYLSTNSDTPCVTRSLSPLPQKRCIEIINELVSIYYRGLMEPLPFFPDISVPWMLDSYENGQPVSSASKISSAEKKAITAFNQSIEYDDYLRRTWSPPEDTFPESFRQAASDILKPLVTCIEP